MTFITLFLKVLSWEGKKDAYEYSDVPSVH
jgi:hypothetical protein